MSSDAQKRAYRKYNEKKKTLSAVYTPTDMQEYIRADVYLSKIGISKNEYLKALIKNDLDRKNIPYADIPEPPTESPDDEKLPWEE